MKSDKIILFTPYFKSPDENRQEELVYCLRHNTDNKNIHKIYLLMDEEGLPEVVSEKIEVISLDRRMSYLDWIHLTKEKCSSGVSLLANSDIYFDETITLLGDILSEGDSFVALSRYEIVGEGASLHKNPHWSQDAWAISSSAVLPENLCKSLDFLLGVPRCDNKIAYLFAIHGYKIYNPCNHVKSYHLHETQLRSYNKEKDRAIMGGVAYVKANADLSAPSDIEFHVWGKNLSRVSKVALNKTFDVWDKMDDGTEISDYQPHVDCIMVPVIRREIHDLLRYIETMPPPSAGKISLVLSIDLVWDRMEIEAIERTLEESGSRRYFSRVLFISCEMTERESIYIRTIPKNLHEFDMPKYGLKTGPNKQFFETMRRIAASDLHPDAVFLQEVDTLPVRSQWVDFINKSIAGYRQALLIGAKCSAVKPLSDDLANHINGNAVLCTGNPSFPDFIKCWEQLVLEVVKKAPWKAYDSATEWAIYYLPRNFGSPFDGKQLCDTDYFKSALFAKYMQMYQKHVFRAAFLVNLADAVRTAKNYCFDFNEMRSGLDGVGVVHLKAALPHRDVLRSFVHRKGGVIAYDAEWQYPAITEKHAANQMRKSPPFPPDSVYFGFPWATLIDLMVHKSDDAAYLLRVLDYYAPVIKNFSRVVTTCQHIFMMKFQDLFSKIGVTDVFWSHCVKDELYMDMAGDIKIHPFPLYPVQWREQSPNSMQRKYLFSFIGAKSPSYYLTNTRNKILHYLSDDPRGYVKGRDSWHYGKIVYDHQIRKTSHDGDGLVCTDASDEFRRILRLSVFSLCPSGSGPNSIRLWESIGAGSIPVILADTYLPPGDPGLWKKAVVFCDETDEAIQQLPDRLAVIAADVDELASKREALEEVWQRYGSGNFVYDIKNYMLEPSCPVGDDALSILARAVNKEKATQPQSNAALLMTCGSRILTGGAVFHGRYHADTHLREAILRVLQKESSESLKQFRSIAESSRLDLEGRYD